MLVNKMAIDISLIFLPAWERLKPYLVIDIYDRDGSAIEPRIRIGFDNMPDELGREMSFIAMPCVACGTANHPLRRRVGDPWSRLYYGPACQVAVRPACSKGRAASLEYQRFMGIEATRTSQQLTLI
jgi:hypothetical protein